MFCRMEETCRDVAPDRKILKIDSDIQQLYESNRPVVEERGNESLKDVART